MSLPTKAIDRLFERLAATYGRAWTSQWADVPMIDVKAAWANELSVFSGWLDAVAWALDNLPARCPNAIEFKQLCRQAPARAIASLPEPKADPERVAAELAKLAPIVKAAKSPTIDHKAWAKRLIARHDAGEKLSLIQLRFAREALGIAKKAVAA